MSETTTQDTSGRRGDDLKRASSPKPPGRRQSGDISCEARELGAHGDEARQQEAPERAAERGEVREDGAQAGVTQRQEAPEHDAERREVRRNAFRQCASERRDARCEKASGLDAELWRLANGEEQADRQLARGLARLRDKMFCRPLGFVRTTDFIREYIGIRASRARWLARLGRGLLAVPELDAALVERQISASQVVELSRIIDSTTPTEERLTWIKRACCKTVRALRKEVQAEWWKRKEASAGDPEQLEIVELDFSADPDEEKAGGWMSIPVPARVAVLWHEAVELCRKVSGHHLSTGQAAEFICAEYLSAVGNEASEETERIEGDFRNDKRAKLLEEVMRAMNREAAAKTRKQPRLEIEETLLPPAERWPTVDWRPPDGELPEDCVVDDEADPWQLAETLLRLSTRKKVLRYQLAGGLDRMRGEHKWHVLGFPSFGEYCEERLHTCRRRAERLIHFRRGLDKYERLRETFLNGRISYTAVLLLLPILHPSTEEVWIRWADGVTYRELEEAVENAKTYHLPLAAPGVIESYIRELQKLKAEEEAARAMSLAACSVEEESEEDATAFAEADSPAGAGSEEDATAFAEADSPAGAGSEEDATAFAEADSSCKKIRCHPATAFALSDPPESPDSDNDLDHTEAAMPPPIGYLAPKLVNLDGVPLGCAVPPSIPGGPPTICGMPDDLTFSPPEFCVGRVRFWAPPDVLEVCYRALRRCRQIMPDHWRETWSYLEVIVVHFIRSQDTPAARETLRRHKIIARDEFRCCCGGCTSRGNLHDHHMNHRAHGGCNAGWNRCAACAGHHGPGLHGDAVEMGGWAPHRLIVRLGINPRTRRALMSYVDGRRVADEEAVAAMAAWRRWLREVDRRRPGEPLPPLPPIKPEAPD